MGHQTHVIVELVNAEQAVPVAIQVRRVVLDLVNVELLQRVSAKHLEHTVMRLTMYANALQLWQLVVEQRTRVIVELANAAPPARVVIQEKHASLELASVELPHHVLGSQLEPFAMLPIMSANVQRRWLNVQLERNVQAEHAFVSQVDIFHVI